MSKPARLQQIRSRRIKWLTSSGDGSIILPMPSQGWTFGSDGDKTLIHTFGETSRVTRLIDNAHPMVEGAIYLVKLTIGGTVGDVVIILGLGTGSNGDATQLYSAGVGAVEFTAAWINGGIIPNSIISFYAGDTDVVISNISVTRIS